jgi:hypothetical protein
MDAASVAARQEDCMRLFIFIAAAIVAAETLSLPALADHEPRAKARHARQKPAPRVERDCTPINGRFGYYGNPWCDTGSSRPPDVEFRDRYRQR